MNPRYTGRQVWSKQRKDDVLIDVEDVALGHATKMRWNERDRWVFSTEIVHEPLIDTDTFEQAQQIMAGQGRTRTTRERRRVRRPYVLRGLVHCGVCERRMQGQWTRDQPYYRCRFPNEYGLANKIEHPRNVYLAEKDVLPPIDDWLATLFAPHRIDETIRTINESQPPTKTEDAADTTSQVVAECDAKLSRYRDALEAGTDPQLIAAWTREVQARKAEALANARKTTGQRRMSEDEINDSCRRSATSEPCSAKPHRKTRVRSTGNSA